MVAAVEVGSSLAKAKRKSESEGHVKTRQVWSYPLSGPVARCACKSTQRKEVRSGEGTERRRKHNARPGNKNEETGPTAGLDLADVEVCPGVGICYLRDAGRGRVFHGLITVAGRDSARRL